MAWKKMSNIYIYNIFWSDAYGAVFPIWVLEMWFILNKNSN